MKQDFCNKAIAFIGHRDIEINSELEEKCYLEIKKLILNENINTLLFGSKSAFDNLCLKIVTQLQKIHIHLQRIYVRAEYEYINDEYQNYLLEYYDDTIFPSCVVGAGKASYVERNRYIIDLCDVAVFYYNKNCNMIHRKSGTKIAYEYAELKNKQIVNLFDMEIDSLSMHINRL